MPKEKITDEEIRLLYQDNLDNIRDLKNQQWRISHYGLLGQAALVAVKDAISGDIPIALMQDFVFFFH